MFYPTWIVSAEAVTLPMAEKNGKLRTKSNGLMVASTYDVLAGVFDGSSNGVIEYRG